ncbi:hypothetical protein NDU88_003610 [Pleurodeles waltl]|uniref:Uncharacterized protein n=1 Tax=Pleurodeles waltl TaxID=8319 RepID=A0AAV7W804_PLEWA|nr:hypothetical protein NDU88_003610 [Pleurodeles waltl]
MLLPDRTARARSGLPQPSGSTAGTPIAYSYGIAGGSESRAAPFGEEHYAAYLAQLGPACRSGRRLLRGEGHL